MIKNEIFPVSDFKNPITFKHINGAVDSNGNINKIFTDVQSINQKP